MLTYEYVDSDKFIEIGLKIVNDIKQLNNAQET